jgi:hydroxyacylglutathione hydrolase
LGNQKKMNYALRADMTKQEFVEEVTDGLLPPPKYFPLNVKMNKEGYEDIATVLDRGTTAMSPEEFELAANTIEAFILDVRHQNEFVTKHIPRSIFIGLNGDFAPWVGALVADTKQPLLLVIPAGKEEEAITRLSRVGFDGTVGYLKGGIDAWETAGKETDSITSVSAADFKEKVAVEQTPIFDVRKEGEYASEHVLDATHTPLSNLNNYLSNFPKENEFFVHCAGGYRSVIAASILKSRGIHNLIDVAGGFGAIKEEGVAMTNYVCPSTL